MQLVKPGREMPPVWPIGETMTCDRCEAEWYAETTDRLEATVTPRPGTGIQTGRQIHGAVLDVLVFTPCPSCGSVLQIAGEIIGDSEPKTKVNRTPVPYEPQRSAAQWIPGGK